jgi:hypothetical protein
VKKATMELKYTSSYTGAVNTMAFSGAQWASMTSSGCATLGATPRATLTSAGVVMMMMMVMVMVMMMMMMMMVRRRMMMMIHHLGYTMGVDDELGLRHAGSDSPRYADVSRYDDGDDDDDDHDHDDGGVVLVGDDDDDAHKDDDDHHDDGDDDDAYS